MPETSSSSERPDQKSCSNLSADERTVPSRDHLPKMIAHDQNEATRRMPITAFTTMSAFMKSVHGDMSMLTPPGPPFGALGAPEGSASGIDCGVGSTGAALGACTLSARWVR